MKKMQVIGMTLVLVAAMMCGCGNKGNTLMEKASPTTSSLMLYTFDGETGTRYWTYNSLEIEKILAEFAKVNAKVAEDWSHEKITFPVYGYHISDTDGNPLEIVWSNGYEITQDGIAYKCNYDFEEVLAAYEWEELGSVTSVSGMPCSDILCLGEDGWLAAFLSPAEDTKAPENISMVLTKQEDMVLTVEFTNSGSQEWMYGEHFSIQVLLDDEWYYIPATSKYNWGFIDIGYILEAGKTREESFNRTMYGELPAGTYRLVVEGMTAEFVIE